MEALTDEQRIDVEKVIEENKLTPDEEKAQSLLNKVAMIRSSEQLQGMKNAALGFNNILKKYKGNYRSCVIAAQAYVDRILEAYEQLDAIRKNAATKPESNDREDK